MSHFYQGSAKNAGYTCAIAATRGPMKEALWIALVGVVIVIVIVIRFAVRAGRRLGTPTQRASLATLHTANLAAPALRTGLNKGSAERSIPHLRQLIGTAGVAIADTFGILAAEGMDSGALRAGGGAGAGGDLERAAPGPVPSRPGV